jgi:hypothetical protein
MSSGRQRSGIDADTNRVWLIQMPPAEFESWRSVLLDPAESPLISVNKYTKELKAGDLAWLWISGPKAGIYGSLVIATDPEDPGDMTLYGGVTLDPKRKWVEVQPHHLLAEPAGKRALLDADPGLKGLSVVRMPWSGTVHKVTDEQHRQLHDACRRLIGAPEADRVAASSGIPAPRLSLRVAHTLRRDGRAGLPTLPESYVRSPLLALGRWLCDQVTSSELGFELDGREASAGELYLVPRHERPGYVAFVRCDNDRLSWGVTPPPLGPALGGELAVALSSPRVQRSIWELVATAKRGLQWTACRRDGGTGRLDPPSAERSVGMQVSSGLSTWARQTGAPVVLASISYDDAVAMTSVSLSHWIAADLSRLVSLVSVSLGLPVRQSPVPYPLPPTDRTRADPLIFISYRRVDDGKKLITSLYRALQERLPECVFLDEQLLAGADWRAYLRARLTEAGLLVVCVSDRALESDVVAWEIDTFAEQLKEAGRPGSMLPVRLAPSMWDGEDRPAGAWSRLACHHAAAGHLDARTLDDFVEQICRAYTDLQDDFRAWYVSDQDRLNDALTDGEGRTVLKALKSHGIDAGDLLEWLPILTALKRDRNVAASRTLTPPPLPQPPTPGRPPAPPPPAPSRRSRPESRVPAPLPSVAVDAPTRAADSSQRSDQPPVPDGVGELRPPGGLELGEKVEPAAVVGPVA